MRKSSSVVSRRNRVGIIGYGRMGRGFVSAMQESELWNIAAICDISSEARELAGRQVLNANIYDSPHAIFTDPSIDALGCSRWLIEAYPRH